MVMMFSDCRGNCEDCTTHYVGGCLAGHGDDGFDPINKKKATEILSKNWYRDDNAKKELLKRYPNNICSKHGCDFTCPVCEQEKGIH